MTDAIFKYLEDNKGNLPSPILIVDINHIEKSYDRLKYYLPEADIYYAMKSNPGIPVLTKLNSLGSSFDTASIPEITSLLDIGVSPNNISFGNTIKKQSDIKIAYDLGIRLFATDSYEDLKMISESAPGSNIFCRILTECEGAEWSLSRKFGCEIDMAIDILAKSKDLGLIPYGVSFHVGSQQTDVKQWRIAIHDSAKIFEALSHIGIDLKMLNLGGGFPATYRRPINSLEIYAESIREYIIEAFGEDQDNWPRIIIEPGRSLVGDSGIIQSEVVRVSQKSKNDEFEPPWIFLDIGKFSGLAETLDESIKYRILTEHDCEDQPCILAGPTCDSADILYIKHRYDMPINLKSGDKVWILSTGAYTKSYSSINFNGFSPLIAHYIESDENDKFIVIKDNE